MTAWKNKLLAISLLALVTGLVIHTGGIAGSARIPMHPQVAAPDSTQVELIYQLQAAFHRAKTNQDIELMMSLWDASATLTVQGNANQTFVGSQQIRSFWETVRLLHASPLFAGALIQNANRCPRGRSMAVLRVPRRRRLRSPRPVDCVGYVPGGNGAQRGRQVGFLGHDGRQGLPSVGKPSLFPVSGIGRPTGLF